MKYSELPKLISYSGNGFSVSLNYLQEQLDSWQIDYGLDLNPDFQRGHVWTEKQQIKFVEFILRGGKCPAILFNSPAFAGRFSKNCDLGEMIVCVDGKQRLTALLKFLRGDLKVFGNNTIYDIEDYVVMRRILYVNFAVNQLQTRKELLQWYLELNEGHIAHTEEELDKVRNMLKE